MPLSTVDRLGSDDIPAFPSPPRRRQRGGKDRETHVRQEVVRSLVLGAPPLVNVVYG